MSHPDTRLEAALPNAVLMPAPSPSATVATLKRWFVSEGAEVAEGDVLAEVCAGRASLEIEARAAGRVERILVPAGSDNVKIATPIAVVVAHAAKQPDAQPRDDAGAASAVVANAGAPQAAAPANQPSMSGTVAAALSGLASAAVAHLRPEPVAKAVASASAAPTVAQQAAATPAKPAPTSPKTLTTAPPQPAKAVRMTYREALRNALAEEMRRNPDVFLIGEEVGEHQGTHRVSEGLLAEFGPQRVVDTPITEAGFTGLAVGAAMAGLRPVVEFMSWNFALLALDHIVNSAAKTLYMSGGTMKVPIVLRGPNGAASRAGAQHSQCLAAWLAHVPGLKVVAPSTPADARGLLKSAIRDDGPVVVLEHEALYATSGDVPEDADVRVPIGRAAVVRQGTDVTVVSYSRGVQLALKAAEQLASEGISAEVIDLRSLRPLDLGTVTVSVRKTNRLVTVEESWPVCSIGSEVCAGIAAVAFDDLDAPPTRVTGADVPMPYAENLERLALPSVDRVMAAVRSVLYV